MLIEPTAIPGCFTLSTPVHCDDRGSFLKTFHQGAFETAGLRSDLRESYVTQSQRGVIRGMHFQTPPADHAKIVFCIEGEVRDVILDLRRGSPAYGQPLALLLSAADRQGAYIPSGCAHGFLSISDTSRMLYQVTSVHDPEHDRGIAWDSFGFDWGEPAPILSARDRMHPALEVFETPFHFDPASSTR